MRISSSSRMGVALALILSTFGPAHRTTALWILGGVVGGGLLIGRATWVIEGGLAASPTDVTTSN